MKHSRIPRSRRGITLIELLLAAAITAMVIGAAGTALLLGFRMFHTTSQTAQEQREIQLIESALKESLQTALSVEFRSVVPGNAEALKHYLFFEENGLVMQLGVTKVDTKNIQSVEIRLQTSGRSAYAQYEIVTQHITYNGVVVMNNVSAGSVNEMTNRAAALSRGSGSVFFMKMPDRDQPFRE